jgi:hypothetical protein
MKKSFFIIGSVLTCFLLLLSCGTTVNIFDEEFPLEKSAVLTISPQFSITSYNGISVKLKESGMGMTGFTIPAGNTTLTFDLDTGRTFGNVRYYGRNFTVSYNFLAGEAYQILMLFSDNDGNYKMSNIGESYLSLFICQNNDYKNPLMVMRFTFN